MDAVNLSHETCAVIQNLKSGLSLEVVTRLRETHLALRERFGAESISVWRQTIEALLAKLASTVRRGEPARFANYVMEGGAMQEMTGLSATDRRLTLQQTRDVLRRNLPAQHGDLACKSIAHALAQHAESGSGNQPQRTTA